MKKLIEEFKAFALKGNVMDMAVGMMIGAAFGKIVTSLVNDVLMPLISSIFKADFTGLKILLVDTGVEETMVYLNYGNFIQTIVDFLIVAVCIFAMVKAINSFKKEEPAPEPEEPKPSDELVALNKIVELLENKK
ncbi:MAG: large-conductance mechanosensitive channel protein MscL [Erysipelotrichaceae bacterium]|nr:large-conductance mechanosensitive channel protein MscL [Erysipelotrichaceae bacterium]